MFCSYTPESCQLQASSTTRAALKATTVTSAQCSLHGDVLLYFLVMSCARIASSQTLHHKVGAHSRWRVCASPTFGFIRSNPRVELGDRLVSVNGVEIDGLEWPLVSKMLEITEDDGVTNLGFFCDQVAQDACTHPCLPGGEIMLVACVR